MAQIRARDLEPHDTVRLADGKLHTVEVCAFNDELIAVPGMKTARALAVKFTDGIALKLHPAEMLEAVSGTPR